jgi:small multidrug resistance pump
MVGMGEVGGCRLKVESLKIATNHQSHCWDGFGQVTVPHIHCMKEYIYLAIAIVSEVVATSALKACDGFTRPAASAFVIIGYVIAFYFLALTLRTIPIGIAYAIWSGAGMILVTAIAWFYYQQRLDLAALIGIGLIVTGVLVLHLFSRRLS